MANWYYYFNETKYGPVTVVQLKNLLANGMLRPDSLIESEDGHRITMSSLNGQSNTHNPTTASGNAPVKPAWSQTDRTAPVGQQNQTYPTNQAEKIFVEKYQQFKSQFKDTVNIDQSFFKQSVLLCLILQWVSWTAFLAYAIYSVILILSYMNDLGISMITCLTSIIIPLAISGFSLFVTMPILVVLVKLMGKLNAYLDSQQQ